MAAPIGNQFWKLRSKHGRDAIFKTADELWTAACEYFNHVDENPWIKNDVIRSGLNAGELLEIPTVMPYTIQGLCLYMDCSVRWFYDFERQVKERDDKDFMLIIARIRETIYNQKLSGAATGAFQPMIIARDLGLQEKAAHEHSGKDGGPIETDQTIKVEFVEGKKEND